MGARAGAPKPAKFLIDSLMVYVARKPGCPGGAPKILSVQKRRLFPRQILIIKTGISEISGRERRKQNFALIATRYRIPDFLPGFTIFSRESGVHIYYK